MRSVKHEITEEERLSVIVDMLHFRPELTTRAKSFIINDYKENGCVFDFIGNPDVEFDFDMFRYSGNIRLYNCLFRAGIRDLCSLLGRINSDLFWHQRIRNLGLRSVETLYSTMFQLGVLTEIEYKYLMVFVVQKPSANYIEAKERRRVEKFRNQFYDHNKPWG